MIDSSMNKNRRPLDHKLGFSMLPPLSHFVIVQVYNNLALTFKRELIIKFSPSLKLSLDHIHPPREQEDARSQDRVTELNNRK